jgi:hypothetical protein
MDSKTDTRKHARLLYGLCVTAVALFFLSPAHADAQTTFGTLTGAVTDPSGAVVPECR